jgi:membrane-associated phospholipid phosphatase
MMKLSITLTFIGTSLLAHPAAASSSNINISGNPVVQWNRELLALVRTPGAQPATIHPTRSFAIMHAAIYDAVNAIDGTHHPYLIQTRQISPGTSEEAAADAAAHQVLITLYPSHQSTIDAAFQQSLAQIPSGRNRDAGVALGVSVANEILALRSNDGSGIKPGSPVFGTKPGIYESTPPNFPKPQFTGWSRVTPFVLLQANQFRSAPPPSLTDAAYTNAFDEVKFLGVAHSTAASLEQQLVGRFWNGAIQNYWNEIAQTAALAHKLSTAQSARLFALLNFSFADGVIAFYDGKYTYNFWRPVTAIRAAASDGNPDTAANTSWLPEVGNTTPDPSYPGAHAVIASAGQAVLAAFFGTDQFSFNVTSEVMAGVQRLFQTFSGAAEEASVSRIYAGVHFRTDLIAGTQLGAEVADYVVANSLTPVIL